MLASQKACIALQMRRLVERVMSAVRAMLPVSAPGIEDVRIGAPWHRMLGTHVSCKTPTDLCSYCWHATDYMVRV
jgi:hypothetical protein